MKNTLDKRNIAYLSIAFVEGATVMACELLGAKMTAPFFGTTIYSWAGVLAVTLGGLAGGYYFGGWMTTRKKPDTLLQFILLATGIFMIFMPLTGSVVMKLVINLSLLQGLMISLSVFLLPPVFLFGMVSPVIIAALVENAGDSGKTAGRVYAVSTVGGVLNTLLLGFYLIPEFGIRWPSISYGVLLLAIAFLFVVRGRKALKAAVVFIVAVGGIKVQATAERQHRSMFNIRYHSEGLLGQVKVADYGVRTDSFGVMPVRGLLVNNTWQTVINLNDGTALLDYIYFIRPLLSYFPDDSKALLVGLGGGTLCSEIQRKVIDVEAVELDERLPFLAKKYFGLNPRTKVITDDGRHFIRTADKKYDLIIFDAFLGENPPWQLLTLESFEEVKGLLNPGGKFIIEFYGYLKGENGEAGRSVFATLQKAGLKPKVIATSFTDDSERNFIFACGLDSFPLENLDYSGTKYTDKNISELHDYLIPASHFSRESYTVITDDNPVLDKMLKNPALAWRRELNTYFRDKLVAFGQPIFY